MSGTKAGGLKAAKTNKERNGEDFFKRIGRIGGYNGHTGGFASDPELAKRAGAIGGRKSKRGKSMSEDTKETIQYLLTQGKSYVEIAKSVNMDYTTVRRYCQREGL